MTRIRATLRRGRAVLTVMLVALSLALSATPALGHSSLIRTDPADGAQLNESPRLVHLWFSEQLALGLTSIELLDGSGQPIPLGAQPLVTQRSASFTVVLPELAPDVYRLSWRVRSDGDLHVTVGSIVFGVQRAVAPSATPIEQTSTNGAADSAAQWGSFVAFAVLCGSLLLAALAVPPAGARMRVRLLRVALAAAAIGGTVLAAIDLRVRAAPSEWSDVLGSTSYGASWAAREVLLAAVAVSLVVMLRGRDGRGAILMTPLLAGLAFAESTQSHAAAAGDLAPLLVGALHLLAAGLWAGGVVALAAAVVPDLRHDTEARTIAMGTLSGFGPFAAGGVIVVAISGLYLGGQVVPSLDALATGVYGHLLLGKIGLALALGALGLANAAALHTRVRALVGVVIRPAAPIDGRPRVGRTIRVEAIAAAGLLFLAAMLTTTDPRAGLATVPATPTEARAASVVDDLFVSSVVRPARVGSNFIDVTVADTRKPALAPIGAVVARLIPDGDVTRAITQTATLVVTDRSGGRYQAAVTLPDAARWQLQISVARAGFPNATAASEINTAPTAPASSDLLERPLGPVLTATASALATAALAIGALYLVIRTRRRPRRRTLALAIAVALLLTSVVPPQHAAAVAAVPSALAPLVAAQISASNAPIDVIVVLRDQFDHRATEGHNRAERERIETEGLRATAARSQPQLLQLMSRVAASTDIERVQPLWITNAIAIRARPSVIRALAASPLVARIDPDLVIAAPAWTAPAPAAALAPEANILRVNADALWALGYTGQNVVVASMDTGVDYTHPDLAAQYRSTNGWFDPYNRHTVPTDSFDPYNRHTVPTDSAGTSSGHGSMTMGIMVGRDGGGSSVGMAPAAQWIAAKIFDDNGTATASSIHAAFQWVITSGATIVNNSWSLSVAGGCDLTFQSDLAALVAAGITPVFAAGNSGPGVHTGESPANDPNALSVGATDNTDIIASFSSRGPDSCGGLTAMFPNVVAPGVGIKSTYSGGTPTVGLYASNSGTSFSAPHVTGALALLQSAFPALTDAQRRAALICSAVDLGALGADPLYGNGILEPLALIRSMATAASMSWPPTTRSSIRRRGSARSVRITARRPEGPGSPSPGSTSRPGRGSTSVGSPRPEHQTS